MLDLARASPRAQRAAVRTWVRILRHAAGMGPLWLPDGPRWPRG